MRRVAGDPVASAKVTNPVAQRLLLSREAFEILFILGEVDEVSPHQGRNGRLRSAALIRAMR
jgi:hypothetical protein